MTYPTSPFRLKTAEWQALPAPILGQNNHEIYVEQVHLDPEEISRMKKGGIV